MIRETKNEFRKQKEKMNPPPIIIKQGPSDRVLMSARYLIKWESNYQLSHQLHEVKWLSTFVILQEKR